MMRHPLSTLYWILVLFLCSQTMLGCKRTKRSGDRGKLVLTQPFRLNNSSQRLLMGTGLSVHKLKQKLRLALQKSKHIVLLPRRKKTADARAVEIIVGVRRLPSKRIRGKRIKVRVQLYVSCQLAPLRGKKEAIIVEEYNFVRYINGQPPSPVRLQQTVLALWKKMSRSIRIFAQLRSMSSSAIQKMLIKANDTTRRHAAYLLGHRRYKQALPSLVSQMKSKNEQVLVATVGALVRLKNRQAAVSLINSANDRDNIYTTQIISALVELGGDVAKGYLFTLEVGHPNKQIQQTAHEGLRELQRQKKN